MKKIIFIYLFLIVLHYSSSAKSVVDKVVLSDTTLKLSDPEDEAIDEVIKSRTLPKKEKVQYLSQETRYGFKDLFKNYSYNSAIPYSSQVNPYAETYMQDYLQSHGAYLQKMKISAVPYFNFIDNILTQYGLPRELKYLAVIESNLNSNATSIAGARGPWQLMSYTAKNLGLTMNAYVDERTDYDKSTHAAAKYLLSLYKDLKDWLLVIAAYNCGPGRVYSAIQKSGSRDFWALQYYLPEESRNHVKKFIATHYIMETSNIEKPSPLFNYTTLDGTTSMGRSALSKTDEDNTEVISLSGKYNAVIIAKNLMMDINEFNRLNQGFDMAMAAGENFDLRLPSDKMDLFERNKYPILNECVHVLLNDMNTETKTVYTKKFTPNKK